MHTALLVFRRVVSAFYYDGWSFGLFSEKLDRFYWICMFTGVMIILFLDYIERKTPFINWINKQKTVVRWSFLYVFILSTVFVIIFSNIKEAGAGNFIYYNF